jgi:hypothetical protein
MRKNKVIPDVLLLMLLGESGTYGARGPRQSAVRAYSQGKLFRSLA